MPDTSRVPPRPAAFALVKPAGLDRLDVIDEVLRSNGLAVVRRKVLRLTEDDAAVVYPEILRQLLGQPHLWQAHVQYLTATNCVCLAIVSSGPEGTDLHSRLRAAKGTDAQSEGCASGTIRSLVPGRGVFNSFHSADSAGESMTMFGYFGMQP